MVSRGATRGRCVVGSMVTPTGRKRGEMLANDAIALLSDIQKDEYADDMLEIVRHLSDPSHPNAWMAGHLRHKWEIFILESRIRRLEEHKENQDNTE